MSGYGLKSQADYGGDYSDDSYYSDSDSDYEEMHSKQNSMNAGYAQDTMENTPEFDIGALMAMMPGFMAKFKENNPVRVTASLARPHNNNITSSNTVIDEDGYLKYTSEIVFEVKSSIKMMDEKTKNEGHVLTLKPMNLSAAMFDMTEDEFADIKKSNTPTHWIHTLHVKDCYSDYDKAIGLEFPTVNSKFLYNKHGMTGTPMHVSISPHENGLKVHEPLVGVPKSRKQMWFKQYREWDNVKLRADTSPSPDGKKMQVHVDSPIVHFYNIDAIKAGEVAKAAGEKPTKMPLQQATVDDEYVNMPMEDFTKYLGECEKLNDAMNNTFNPAHFEVKVFLVNNPDASSDVEASKPVPWASIIHENTALIDAAMDLIGKKSGDTKTGSMYNSVTKSTTAKFAKEFVYDMVKPRMLAFTTVIEHARMDAEPVNPPE